MEKSLERRAVWVLVCCSYTRFVRRCAPDSAVVTERRRKPDVADWRLSCSIESPTMYWLVRAHLDDGSSLRFLGRGSSGLDESKLEERDIRV